MTAEPVAPEMLNAWAICLQASEEARRRAIADMALTTSCSRCSRSLD